MPRKRTPERAGDGERETTNERQEKSVCSVHFAVEGCCHGELDKIYEACASHEQQTGERIDFLLCCGDFQAVRNSTDMHTMAVPEKYLVMGDFAKYCGPHPQVTAPYLTIFIGGNHEAANHLWENYYGGYVAPRIFYLGHSGVVNICGLRIAGLSGIFKGRDFYRAYSLPPFNEDTKREAYHVRQFEIGKLQLLREPVDIVMSHDWPVGITSYGNEAQLLRHKPFFKEDIEKNQLGNPHTLALLKYLKPKFWFAAHLHCHFEAAVPHIIPGALIPKVTQFVALDKCLPGKKCLEFFTVTPKQKGLTPIQQEAVLSLDAEWLDIIHFSDKFLHTARAGEVCKGNAFDKSPVLSTTDVPRIYRNSTKPLPLPSSTVQLMREMQLSDREFLPRDSSVVLPPGPSLRTSNEATFIDNANALDFFEDTRKGEEEPPLPWCEDVTGDKK